MDQNYPRDLKGYGRSRPNPQWPHRARVALSIVLNYEEGGEYCILHGDEHSESALADMTGLVPLVGDRNINVESVYEYGSRIGFWRILRVLEQFEIPATVFAVGMALERNRDAAAAMTELGFEVASHGWRWIDYQAIPEQTERDHIDLAITAIEKLTGNRPVGWYTGRPSPRTRRLIVEKGGFLYESDAYNDELPYWTEVAGTKLLILPYSFLNNDSRFTRSQGFDLSEEFFIYLRDTFDRLYEEGEVTPSMMSVGLHCRLVGHPGRIAGLVRFLDHVRKHDRVWICKRVDIARHWISKGL